MLLAMLIIAAVLLIFPAVLCCLVGGWLLLFGVLGLVTWVQIGWWIGQDLRRYITQGGYDEYA